ncbi:LysR family transcriptional regulator [Aquabacter cavernae]|uniref:LysR family transcriptional regulator n=1 Tax=Aquabacter cavernae TaxID=2496029 RepID=UPI001FDEFC30|nr:LysR family transcriptional regulator [Aquabacter cavernae]
MPYADCTLFHIGSAWMEAAWLEDFLALAECMNFSRAAERRNITQPAFSRRIRALEAWVGAPLIDRDTHRLALTPAGTAFLPAAEQVLHLLQRGRTAARETAQAGAGELTFLATHALSLTFFPQWLRSLEGAVGDSAVRLMADNMVACERLMLEGRAQFLLCHHHPAAHLRLEAPAFRSVRLGGDMLVPVCGRDGDGAPLHCLPGTAQVPLPYLAFSTESGMGRIVEAARAAGGPAAALRPVFTSHLSTALAAQAAAGRGIAFAPLSLVADDLEPGGRLARAGDTAWDIPMDILLVRPRARMIPAAEAFWEMAAG